MITVVTTNKGKAAEIAAFFAGVAEIEAVSLDLVEPQAETLEEISEAKARQAYEQIHRPLIVDDTGLFIDALHGFPGPYAAYVQKTIGNAGILSLLKDTANRNAHFSTVVAYADASGIRVFSGRIDGTIAHAPRGSAGFGYDPIFTVGEKTLAEMKIAEKNRISHRARALEAFKEWYQNQRNG